MNKSTVLRMDNVGIVVEDLKAAVAFFTELGLAPAGEATVEGPWVDRIVGMSDVRSDIAMMQTPDGRSKIELTKFQKPASTGGSPREPQNTLGKCRIMFAVSNLDEVLARLQANHGAELVGEVVQYEDAYRLCYVRGPEGFIVALAQPLREGL